MCPATGSTSIPVLPSVAVSLALSLALSFALSVVMRRSWQTLRRAVRLITGRCLGEAGRAAHRRAQSREGPTVISIPAYTLNDGTSLPALGLGTWPMKDEEAERAVRAALETGYRLIDTATNYRNETGVGRGVASAGLPARRSS